jgi:hypothetical protein
LQTIPALALLAFLIAALDRIGTVPAIAALFLYGLLPIVRNTQSGSGGHRAGVERGVARPGIASGARLRLIELPLASRSILAGIKTSAVINVGTATIAASSGGRLRRTHRRRARSERPRDAPGGRDSGGGMALLCNGALTDWTGGWCPRVREMTDLVTVTGREAWSSNDRSRVDSHESPFSGMRIVL